MRTACTALAVWSGCTAARWYLDRSSCREASFCRGRVRLEGLWNRGAAFSLPLPVKAVSAASAAVLGAVWLCRKNAPTAAGLILGGGLSNLTERALNGQVYDYIRFPHAPGALKRCVFNLADLAILTGAALFP